MGWQPNVLIHDQTSQASPALAEYGGRLHMVHLGEHSRRIWHSTFDGTSWTKNVLIHDQTSQASPALAEYGGRLHMVHLGEHSRRIWHSVLALEVSNQEQQIIDLTNEMRQSVGGCDPVEPDPRLLNIARAHSQDLADHPELHGGHIGSDGSLGVTEDDKPGRIRIAMGHSGFEGENVVSSYPTATAAFDSWFNEELHRQNILNCNFKFIGVGIAKASDGALYYTQDFFG